MNRLVLIDGNAILHRAFHAIPPLTLPSGTPVNAVYGFATMLLRINENLHPTAMAVVFDRPAPTFRKKMFAGYQSKRPKMDDALVAQIEPVHALVSAFGLPIFEKDGFEADDVIGTLSKRVKDQVIIVTGDRDILQLVNTNVLVYMPTKGLSEAKLYGEKEVEERMGVPPKRIPDLKGLMGDASDNYPGVEGIGPKTAIKLLSTYNDLHGVMQSDALTRDQKESAKLSYELATIRTDVPLDGDIPSLASLDTPAARAFFETYRFHSLMKRLTGTEQKKPKVQKQETGKKKDEQQELF